MSDDNDTGDQTEPKPSDKQTAVPKTRRDFLVTTTLSTAALVVACGDDDGGLDGGFDGGMGGPDGGPDAPPAMDGGMDASMPDAGDDAGGASDAGDDAFIPSEGPEALPESAELFPMGVSAGDASTDSVVLWTRYAGAGNVQVQAWAWDGAAYGERVLDEPVTIEDGGFAHVLLSGLVPGARYRYVFLELTGGAPSSRSAIGNARTAIADDALELLRIGAASCSRNGIADFGPLRAAGMRTDLDAFLLLGDTTYNDGASTVAEFRAKWAENLSREEYKSAFAATALYATWDDHEIDNNWNPEDISAARRDAGTAAFFEHMPLRRNPEDADRVWRSHRWGNTLEIFVLDCRGERFPSRNQYISPEQMLWLKTGLSESPARFKIIMNSVGITRFPFTISQADRWQGYAAQRTEILSHIDDMSIPGVLWVAGDFHFTCLGHVGPREGDLGWDQYEVLVGPVAQTTNIAHLICRPPQFPYASGEKNYVEIVCDPAAGEITLNWYGGDGAVFETQVVPA